MRIQARAKGGVQERQRLERAAESVAAKTDAALRAGAAMIAASARRRVMALRDPERLLPSILADSIAVEDGRHGVDVVARADYAPYVEFGTRAMPAQPFLSPAFEEHRDAIRAQIAEALSSIRETTG